MDPKIIKFPVWDLETDEIIEMEMDEESYHAMVAADKEQEELEKEIRLREQEERRIALRCAKRNDE